MSQPRFVAIDWGTSSFRLWVLGAAGALLAEERDSCGMSTLTPPEYAPLLEGKLAKLGVAADVPVLICGMAGARTGWKEAPYTAVPADVHAVVGAAVRVPGVQRDIRILPGAAQSGALPSDVMRGEETILLGAALEAGAAGLICMPGTHSKWARMEAATLTGFSTAMTGEMFAILSKSSTLAHYAKPAPRSPEGDAVFAQALQEAVDAPQSLLHRLFSVRATPLLSENPESTHMAERLSGLLIGMEIAGAERGAQEAVTLISAGGLADRYAFAFDLLGIPYQRLDSDEMCLAGLKYAAATLWG